MTLSDRDLGKIHTLQAEATRARVRLDQTVMRLRDSGATWTELGYALGITAQGAQKRYGTGSERAEAHAARAAARAEKRANRSSRSHIVDPNPDQSGAEPWPDGTTQATISPESAD